MVTFNRGHYFFKDFPSIIIIEEDIRLLEEEILVIICRPELIFPPSFFYCMEHLPIHLPYEARVVGPVQYQWMYTFQRTTLKLIL